MASPKRFEVPVSHTFVFVLFFEYFLIERNLFENPVYNDCWFSNCYSYGENWNIEIFFSLFIRKGFQNRGKFH